MHVGTTAHHVGFLGCRQKPPFALLGGTGPVDGPNAARTATNRYHFGLHVYATVSTYMLSKPKNACGNNSPASCGLSGMPSIVGGGGGGVARWPGPPIRNSAHLPLHPLRLIRGLVRIFFISWDRGLKDIVWVIYDQGNQPHPHPPLRLNPLNPPPDPEALAS